MGRSGLLDGRVPAGVHYAARATGGLSALGALIHVIHVGEERAVLAPTRVQRRGYLHTQLDGVSVAAHDVRSTSPSETVSRVGLSLETR